MPPLTAVSEGKGRFMTRCEDMRTSQHMVTFFFNACLYDFPVVFRHSFCSSYLLVKLIFCSYVIATKFPSEKWRIDSLSCKRMIGEGKI